jgi:hypothetical protein
MILLTGKVKLSLILTFLSFSLIRIRYVFPIKYNNTCFTTFNSWVASAPVVYLNPTHLQLTDCPLKDHTVVIIY